jgi:NADP-dependent 3-hydroxy acid dehydrogenase YdfG
VTETEGNAIAGKVVAITGAGRGIIAGTRDPDELAALTARPDAMAMPPQAVAETIAFAIAQPDSVDIGEVIVRPAVQP